MSDLSAGRGGGGGRAITDSGFERSIVRCRRGRRRQGLRFSAVAAVMLVASMLTAAAAHALLVVAVNPSFPDTVTVGQTFPAAIGISNSSTPPESTDFPVLAMSEINLVPACTNTSIDCVGGVEPGVFTPSATGTGTSGPASCLGTWTITEVTPETFRFTPPGGEGSLQLAAGQTCVVDFTVTTLRLPTVDVDPGLPGVQTSQLASVTGTGGPSPVRNSGSDVTTVLQAAPTMTTQATPTVPAGQAISDTATLTGPPDAPQPTGTVTFTLFGPNDATCSGPPIFTSANRPVGGGPPLTATSDPFTPTAAGEYRWIAIYSGDANYIPMTSLCNDANENSTVVPAAPTITTEAAGPVTVTQPISDTAQLSGGFNPTGTITFNLYGPNDASCAGPPIFASVVPVDGNGVYNSGPFTPVSSGTFNWTVTYSGDANNAPASSPCGAPGETSVVRALPTVDVDKTADPNSLPEPGGTFTFTVVVTNTSTESLTITSLTDNIYGDLATRPGSSCGALIGTVLAPGASSAPCAFPGQFNGVAGDTQTDVVTVTATNATGVQATGDDDAVVTITLAPLSILVEKSADPTTLPEPGGDFTYTVVVTNTSGVPLTITSLTDDVVGDLVTDPDSTCDALIGTVLTPGETSAPCSFTGSFTGEGRDTLTNLVTVTATDNGGRTVTGTDDATVTITDVLPTITVDKLASPTSLSAPGGTFGFLVEVTNTSAEPVTITTITDDVYGNVTTQITCPVIGTVLDPDESTMCIFTGDFIGVVGDSQTDTVTAAAVDNDGSTATASDSATVTITDPPRITIEKTATPASRPVPGGTFTFDLVITNVDEDPLIITALTDDIYGDVSGRGNCSAVGRGLAPSPGPGNTYSCSFSGEFSSASPASQTDIVTVEAVNQAGTPVSDSDDATVTITAAAPTTGTGPAPTGTGTGTGTGTNDPLVSAGQGAGSGTTSGAGGGAVSRGPLSRTGAELVTQIGIAVALTLGGLAILESAGAVRLRRSAFGGARGPRQRRVLGVGSRR